MKMKKLKKKTLKKIKIIITKKMISKTIPKIIQKIMKIRII